jgi:HK97 family phage prohead protease
VRFAGYVAVFDREDRGGDVIRKGAFAGELSKPVPLLWQHDVTCPIGEVEMLAEDDRGLRIIGRVADDAGVVAGSGLSFGYRVLAARDGTKRELTALELIEVSVVNFPMQPLARVHAVQIQNSDFTKENMHGL